MKNRLSGRTRRLRVCISFICIHFFISFAYAQISFENADLNGADGLLFSSGMKQGFRVWKNLYSGVLDARSNAREALNAKPRLLTCFPQKLESLQNGSFLQIRNADGVFIYASDAGTLTRMSVTESLYPSPAVFARVRSNLIETSISPDGNWICMCKKKDSVFGSIVLASTQTGKELVLVEKTDFSFTKIPVLWSPDSRVLIYEKNNRLYFIEPKNAFDPALAEEKFRSIGEGSISSVQWAGGKKLIYIRGNSVFTLSAHELYTRSLYAAMLGTGKTAGNLPLSFDEDQDSFWTDTSGTRFVVVQGGQNVFYFNCADDGRIYNSAFFSLQNGPADFSVFWISSSEETAASYTADETLRPLVWTEYFAVDGARKSAAYILDTDSKKSARLPYAHFDALALPEGAVKPALSPDKTKLAFCTEEAVYVYNPRTWTAEHIFQDEKIISFCWKNASSVYTGGDETVREWELATDTKKILFLSSAGDFMWAEDGTTVVSTVKAGTFRYKPETNTWTAAEKAAERTRQTMNKRWRIISEDRSAGFYKNLFFVRSLRGPGKTLPLLSDISDQRTEEKKIALAFEAFDNNEYTACILNMLHERGLRASFFINGEFMRRFPESVKAIAAANHECASSFYTTVDLLSDDFIIDETFIRRGLARNEDEFYALTQKDLKLLWIPPYGKTSALIERAGMDAGYKMIKNPINRRTEFLSETAKNCDGILSAQTIADICANVQSEDIILIPCGVKGSCSVTGVCDKLEVLINAVSESGYTILPVSALVY
ncbi:polysaccharide deacetylase family protein [Treponema sp. HNW]|uniref:polysaccharide deacetylase family protein n=1 Tax=Treponema sp. HNW TaxID=3116654 RepID=UPI003D12DD09